MGKYAAFIIIVCILAGTFEPLRGAPGDVIHVISHDKVIAKTDPSKGFNLYSNKTLFPSKDIEYRKVVLYVTYECPDSLHCGGWDYIDNVWLRHYPDGGDTLDIELARIISPYGWWFDSSWHFTWHVNITDFAFLLHDTVEVVFRHTGYENSEDRGWKVTVDFAITEGSPVMHSLGMDTLWCGSFAYGDSSKPIEKYLAPMAFSHEKAAVARMRIVQTGHGMDDYENCAEFCKKYRRVYLDTALIDHKEIWRQCGDNPLYPQAGTWIFDRAGWCPGSMVTFDYYDFEIVPESTYKVDIEMQAYLNAKNPTANYYIYSYLFYYEKPWAENDVAIEEILAPSSNDIYSRLNPTCRQPMIIIKNNGSKALDSVMIKYGIKGEEMAVYNWRGHLPSQQSLPVALLSQVSASEGRQEFKVTLKSPNGVEDEYPDDNRLTSIAIVPPIINNEFILVMRTNKEPWHNYYQIVDGDGVIVRGRALGSLGPDSTYYDTVSLIPGCYQLMVTDTAGDGLEFWFNAAGGYGYVRLLDINGRLFKNFNSDFGRNINYCFNAVENAPPPELIDTLPLVRPFPSRTAGAFNLYLFANDPTDMKVKIVSDSSQTVVYEKDYHGIKDAILPLDISGQPDGIYNVNVIADGQTVKRRIRIKHDQ